MKRIQIKPRDNWQRSVEQIGFAFHTSDLPYWDESVYYSLTIDEVGKIENATAILWDMCLTAVQYVIDRKLYVKFAIDEYMIPVIEKSWNDDHPAIYGRFDLCYKDKEIKMLEFNADTPTSLFEAAVVQWHWLQALDSSKDQFNSIHDKLISHWLCLKDRIYQNPLYFTCIKESLEDITTVEYLRDTAIQAGIETRFIFIEDIGWDKSRAIFVDDDAAPIKNIFKLYPYEMMMEEPFGKKIPLDINHAFWIEPAWKMLLSSKAILPILWHLFPGHELLLESSFEKRAMASYAQKPIWSREGSNICLCHEGKKIIETQGDYGNNATIYQALFELPQFEGRYPVIGSWMIGHQPAGIGIRESDSLITSNTSRFVPHLIDERAD
jgi:glutathionylspermidine synthase